MGYSYSFDGKLCCDHCGKPGGVRKRKCPHFVLTDNARSKERARLSYCYPPALCEGCKEEQKATLHASCAANAAKSQEQYDAVQARLDSGDKLVLSAWGDWHETVPAGFVGVLFGGPRYEGHEYRLIPSGDYDPGTKQFLSEYGDTQTWTQQPARSSKFVTLLSEEPSA